MLIASINYQNNMSYALTFLLANLFVVAVLHSYANLSGLTLTALNVDDAFPGQQAAFHLRLACSNSRGHQGLRVALPAVLQEPRRKGLFRGLFSAPSLAGEIQADLKAHEQQLLSLHVAVGERGWFRPGRLRVESVYPLGLLRCWTWVDLDFRAIVYPTPKALGEPHGSAGDNGEGNQLSGSGEDEFYGLRDYRAGDSPRRVYWKGVARGQEVQSKDFAAVVSDQHWLDWDDYPSLGVEQRLSALARRVLDYQRQEVEYGLRIPGTELAPAGGERHRERALRALALYGVAADV